MPLFRTSFGLLLLIAAALPLAAEPERSVVKIINYSQQPDWQEPWRFLQVTGSTGSGFVIEGDRILTNAHVVSWSNQILVQRYQDPKPYRARLAYFGRDCDLAVLEVVDPDFFEGIEPLEIGELPPVRSTVTTYGYPAGGQQISYTRGVISRIEMQRYVQVHNRSLLTVQTDAAINPGNSGGPVILDGKVVGVSFQGNPRLENAGFFIPPEVVRHFLEDIEDGSYDGFPDAGIALADLHNPAFREALELPDALDGARIDRILHPFPETHERLRPNDVLLEIADHPVGSDGTILYKGNRVHGAVLFDQVQHGGTIDLKVWRDGAALDLRLPLYVNRADRIEGRQYDPPPYLVVGGLVFTELSLDYLLSLGRDWRHQAGPLALQALFNRDKLDEASARARPIVLSKILRHPINVDFGVEPRSVLTELNGLPVRSMDELAAALEAGEGDFHHFRFIDGRVEALRRAEAEAATEELLETYQIPVAFRPGLPDA